MYSNFFILSEQRGRTCQGLDEVADAESDAMLMFVRIEWDPRDARGEMSAAPPPRCSCAKFAINNDPIKTHNQTFLCSEKHCCAVSNQSYEFQLRLQLELGTVKNRYPSVNCPTPSAASPHDAVADKSIRKATGILSD